MSPSFRRVAPRLALVLAISMTACARPRPPRARRPGRTVERPLHLAPAMPTTAEQLLLAHNRARADFGLPPLRLNLRLNAAARGHAEQMAAEGRSAHDGIGDGDLAERLEVDGYDPFGAAENIAAGTGCPASAVRDWMHAEDSRATILGRYTEMGGGVARGPGGASYWCVVFGNCPAR